MLIKFPSICSPPMDPLPNLVAPPKTAKELAEEYERQELMGSMKRVTSGTKSTGNCVAIGIKARSHRDN